MNAYEAYKKYVALKLHFQRDSYDYFKFSGGVKVSRDKFETRRDKYFFQRISKLYTEKQFEQLLVSNFIVNKNVWVGDLLSEDGRKVYTNWKKTYQSLEYSFTEDLNKIKEIIETSYDLDNLDDLFVVNDCNNWPEIVNLVIQHTIHLETFILINKILNFIPRIDKQIDDGIIWPEFRTLCIKYSPFLDIDIKKYKSIMKNIFVSKNA